MAQARGDDVVVVAVPRVRGDAVVGRRMGTGVVVEGHDHDGLTAGEDDARVGPALVVAGEPAHVTVFFGGNPILVGVCVFGPSGGGDADFGKAEFECFFDKQGLDGGGVDGGVLPENEEDRDRIFFS